MFVSPSDCLHASLTVCMYVCLIVCTYACVYVRMYVCMYMSMNVCMSVCMYVNAYNLHCSKKKLGGLLFVSFNAFLSSFRIHVNTHEST